MVGCRQIRTRTRTSDHLEVQILVPTPRILGQVVRDLDQGQGTEDPVAISTRDLWVEILRVVIVLTTSHLGVNNQTLALIKG